MPVKQDRTDIPSYPPTPLCLLPSCASICAAATSWWWSATGTAFSASPSPSDAALSLPSACPTSWSSTKLSTLSTTSSRPLPSADLHLQLEEQSQHLQCRQRPPQEHRQPLKLPPLSPWLQAPLPQQHQPTRLSHRHWQSRCSLRRRRPLWPHQLHVRSERWIWFAQTSLIAHFYLYSPAAKRPAEKAPAAPTDAPANKTSRLD